MTMFTHKQLHTSYPVKTGYCLVGCGVTRYDLLKKLRCGHTESHWVIP